MAMEEIDDKKLRELQIDILKAVTEFCDAHDIGYWLDFGTLIGAVRHNDYIPWDDDIDISMLRKDYDKFMRTFNAENSRYKFNSYELDKSFGFPYGKVLDTTTVLYEPSKERCAVKLSVNIDVFPYDNAPVDKKQVARMQKRRDRLSILETARKHRGKARGGILRRIAVALLSCFAKMFPRDYFLKRIVKNAKKYSGTETGYVSDFAGSFTYFTCERSKYENTVSCRFGDRSYKIPEAYDQTLRSIYGDYMQLPPENERVSHHKYEAYISDNGEIEK